MEAEGKSQQEEDQDRHDGREDEDDLTIGMVVGDLLGNHEIHGGGVVEDGDDHTEDAEEDDAGNDIQSEPPGQPVGVGGVGELLGGLDSRGRVEVFLGSHGHGRTFRELGFF